MTVVAVALLVVATTCPAAAKAGPAAGAAGSGSPLLAAVDVGLEVDQVLDGDANIAAVAGVDLALAAPRSWTYLDDLARFVEDAKWRLEVDAQGLGDRCPEPSARLKTRVRGYQQFGGGNKAGELSLIPYAARVCEPSRTAGLVRGLLTTTDPLGYVDGPNLYQFALNNPVNFSDPMGLYSWGGFKRDVKFGFDFYLAAAENVYGPRNLWRNTQRGAGGVYGEVRLVGGMAFSLAQLAVDNPVGGVPSAGAMVRNIQRIQALDQAVSHPGDTVANSWNEMVASVEAHEAAGEYFSSGADAGEWGANAGLVVIGGAELAVGAFRLAAGGLVSAETGLVSRVGRARFGEYMRFRQQGYSPAGATRLSRPYTGVGQHFVQQAYVNRLIARVGEGSRTGRFLSWYRDSPLNVVRGRNMSTGQFYEYHSRIHGAPAFGPRTAQGMRLLPGEPWRAASVTPALTPYGRLGYLWYGSPTAVKFAAGGAVAGGGAAAAWLWPWN